MVQTNIPVNEALCKTAAETETFLMPVGMEGVLVCNTQLTYCWNIPHNEKLLNDTLLTHSCVKELVEIISLLYTVHSHKAPVCRLFTQGPTLTILIGMI